MYVDVHTNHLLVCFQCDCDGLGSLLCIDLVQACIICAHCNGECTTLVAVATVIVVTSL